MKFFKKKRDVKKETLDKLYMEILDEQDDKRRSTLIANVDTLSKAQSYDCSGMLTKDTVFKVVFGTLIPVVAMLVYEKSGVVTTKVFSKIHF